jgi:sec-independent protein translocase protein TatB
MFLDPAKLLVILIVALVVLGPDKLPTVARQMGAAWGEIRRFRERLETEVRGTFPDLPSTHQVAQAVRSPLSFLDQLADAHEREQQNGGDQDQDQADPDEPLSIQPSAPLSIQPTTPATNEESGGATSAGTGPDAVDSEKVETVAIETGPVETGPVGSVSALTGGSSQSSARRVGRTRPWRGSEPAETPFIPDDPSMN